jgi:hypothetical protein
MEEGKTVLIGLRRVITLPGMGGGTCRFYVCLGFFFSFLYPGT